MDGVPGPSMLHIERRGAGPRLVLVHGFTQTARCWGTVGDDLGADHEVAAVDAPGHGGSSTVHVDLRQGAALVADAARSGTYLGYSMGGRLALQLALDRPRAVERLVLVSATAGLDDPADRAARRLADEQLASRIEELGVAAFVDEWLGQPLFATLAPEAACRAERLRNTTAGLASSLRLAGTGAMDPLWDRLGELARREVPVLVVAGALDERYVAIAQRLVAGIGSAATLLVVPDAGHTVHLERPEVFVRSLRRWLDETAG